jgi:hypothetical protein
MPPYSVTIQSIRHVKGRLWSGWGGVGWELWMTIAVSFTFTPYWTFCDSLPLPSSLPLLYLLEHRDYCVHPLGARDRGSQ